MDASVDDDKAVVIDNGSATIRAGFGGDEAPRTLLPTALLSSQHAPIEHGIVTNWYD
jgi:actin-related protein